MEQVSKLTGVVAASLVTVFGASGCASISFTASHRPVTLQRGTAEENTSLFTDQGSFEARVAKAALADGMTPQQAFAALDLDLHKFKSLTGKELMDAAYAGANPTPQTDEAMRRIMDLVNRTAVYQLNYKHVAAVTGVGLDLSAQTKVQGFDRQMTLIFVDGKLQNARKVLSGNPSVDISNTSHIWDSIGNIASGAVTRAAPKPF